MDKTGADDARRRLDGAQARLDAATRRRLALELFNHSTGIGVKAEELAAREFPLTPCRSWDIQHAFRFAESARSRFIASVKEFEASKRQLGRLAGVKQLLADVVMDTEPARAHSDAWTTGWPTLKIHHAVKRLQHELARVDSEVVEAVASLNWLNHRGNVARPFEPDVVFRRELVRWLLVVRRGQAIGRVDASKLWNTPPPAGLESVPTWAVAAETSVEDLARPHWPSLATVDSAGDIHPESFKAMQYEALRRRVVTEQRPGAWLTQEDVALLLIAADVEKARLSDVCEAVRREWRAIKARAFEAEQTPERIKPLLRIQPRLERGLAKESRNPVPDSRNGTVGIAADTCAAED
ncbi:MAG: hypothetical protein EP329_09850 [Deltaproteobacteria bacterium]|nr:MAG: hypothetical protein EP329_09850 [Deltaproteobacteria bacterium]